MINQGKFEIEIEKEEKKEKVTVVMQSISPLIVSDILSESTGTNGKLKIGTFITKAVEEGLVVSPKDLLSLIEEADNAISVQIKIYEELNKFCSNPRLYQLKQTQTKGRGKKESMEDSI